MIPYIYKSFYPSPVGVLKIKFTTEAVTSIEFVDEENISNSSCTFYLFNKKARQMHRMIYKQFNEYFTGIRKKFNLPITFEGTTFQIKVWQELQKIPFGDVKSYKKIACNIGKSEAARAVGAANHKNPLVILIPCHRVIGGNGHLKGYAGGIEKKKWLLNHEQRHSEQ